MKYVVAPLSVLGLILAFSAMPAFSRRLSSPELVGACRDSVFDWLLRSTEAACLQVIQNSCENPSGCSCGQASGGSWAVQRSATCVDKVEAQPPVIGACNDAVFDFLIRDTEEACNQVIQNSCDNPGGCSCGHTSTGKWAVQRSATCIDKVPPPANVIGECSDAIFDYLIRSTEEACSQLIQNSCENPSGCSCGQTSGGSWAVQRSPTCVDKGGPVHPIGECPGYAFDYLSRSTEAACNALIQKMCSVNPGACSCAGSHASWKIQRSATCMEA